nr:hypothetical protein [Edaphobacter bradus]
MTKSIVITGASKGIGRALVEAAFDTVAEFVEVLVVLPLLSAVDLGGDDDDGSHVLCMGEDLATVVAAIGDARAGRWPG